MTQMTQPFPTGRDVFPLSHRDTPPMCIRSSTRHERDISAGRPRSEPALLFSPENELLTRARRIVEMHLDDPLFGVQELADALYMSRSQLHRKMIQTTGRSAGHFIRSIRLERARCLLASTEYSIADVAYSCGFADPAYFSRIVRKTWGQPPSSLRKRSTSRG